MPPTPQRRRVPRESSLHAPETPMILQPEPAASDRREDAMPLAATPLLPSFAARIAGVDLAALIPGETAALREAIDTYSVLILPSQTLDDDNLLALGKTFGDVEPPRNHRVVQRLKHAELADISNLDASSRLRARDDQRRLDSLG